jgi:hypothetical protein
MISLFAHYVLIPLVAFVFGVLFGKHNQIKVQKAVDAAKAAEQKVEGIFHK